ncbi:hypothetical protein [Rhodospirillum sp. A1_3_36]|uniref:hypothetical protein n=1 Tax=Rhodospirillum sp. A1_3_36 TaxID=3391666 RepID=UPI0039A5EA2D
MSDLRLQLILDLGGNLAARAAEAARRLRRLGTDTQQSMAMANRAAAGFDRGLSKLGNRYTGFLSAAGIGVAVKGVGSLDDRMRRLGIESGKSDEKIAALKSRIFEVANMPDIRLDPDQLISALEEVQGLTGNLDFGVDALREVGLALQGTGADGSALGKVLSTMNLTMDIKSTDDVRAALAVMIGQGKEGAFVFRELAGEGPSAMAAIASSGRRGVGALREMGAVLQALRPNFGGPAEVVTAYEAFFETLQNGKNIEFLKANGIDIWEDEAKGIMKSFPTLTRAIMQATGGDVVQLGQVFSDTALKAMLPFANQWRTLGDLPSLDKFMAVDGDFSQVSADSARAAEGFGAALQSLTTAANQFANTELSGPVADLADAIGSLDPAELQEYLELAKQIAMVGGGLVGANMLARNFTGKGIGQLTVAGAGRLFGRRPPPPPDPPPPPPPPGGGGGGPGPNALQRVQVTNWPTGLQGQGNRGANPPTPPRPPGPPGPPSGGPGPGGAGVQRVRVSNWPPGLRSRSGRGPNPPVPPRPPTPPVPRLQRVQVTNWPTGLRGQGNRGANPPTPPRPPGPPGPPSGGPGPGGAGVQRVRVSNWPPGLRSRSGRGPNPPVPPRPPTPPVPRLQRVQVTNWPPALLSGGSRGPIPPPPGPVPPAPGPGPGGRGRGLLNSAGRAAGAAGVAMAATQLAAAAIEGDGRGAAGAGGSMAGAWAGGAAGAAIGTMLLPGIGTAIGGGIGAIGGAIGGEELATSLYDTLGRLFSDNGKNSEPVSGEIVVRVESAEGTTAQVRGVKRHRGPVDLAAEARTGATMGGG